MIIKKHILNKLGVITLSTTMLAGGILPSAASAKTSSELSSLAEEGTLNFDDFNLSTMNQAEKQALYDIVEIEAAKFPGSVSDKEKYKQALVGIFNPNASNYNDLDETAELMSNNMMRLKIVGVNVLGAALNVIIGVVVTGSLGYGAVSTYIKKVGKKEASRVFTKSVKSKLIAVGAGTFASITGKAMDFALEYSDIGGKIASYIDSKDKSPKNGWIDV